MEEIKKYTIRINKSAEGFIQRSDGSYSTTYDKDFYITLPIYKESKLNDYVNVWIDPDKLIIERQLVNPYFIELNFFENISSVLQENSIDGKSVEVKAKTFGIDIQK